MASDREAIACRTAHASIGARRPVRASSIRMTKNLRTCELDHIEPRQSRVISVLPIGEENAMAKGEFLVKYQGLSTEDRRTFDRWLKANAVIASIFAMALVAMAINSSGPPWPATATAKSAETGDITAS